MTTKSRHTFENDLLVGLARHYIGYHDLIEDIDRFLTHAPRVDSYPPYNVLATGKDEVQVELAVAGFRPEDIAISSEEAALIIHGEQKVQESRNYLFQGISARKFSRVFRLADYWEVKDASFSNGILTITLKREVPEKLKPKTIEIKTK